MDAGSKSSYELLEFVILAHKLRLVITYRPSYSTEQKVSLGVYLTEFVSCIESVRTTCYLCIFKYS